MFVRASLVALALLAVVAGGCRAIPKSEVPEYIQTVANGRYYVMDGYDTFEVFQESGHLPVTATHIAAGPYGETVIIEASKDDPTLEERLWREFEKRNFFYAEYPLGDEVYVLGQPEAVRDLPEITPVNTVEREGLGPRGETVVFQADPGNEWFAKHLIQRYKEKHYYYAEEIRDGKLYVFGSDSSHLSFKQGGELAGETYQKVGPNKEDVVIEDIPDNPQIHRFLKMEFNERYGSKL